MDRFHENLALWQLNNKKNQKGAEQLKKIVTPCSVSLCTTISGNPNLCLEPLEEREGKVFLHSQNDPAFEAKEWFASLDLAHVQALFVYGIGLGYYYEAAKEWLKEDKDRYLIFLEDDDQVMRQFFDTERCTELLKDPQVYLFLLGERNQQILQFTDIISLFHGVRYHFTGLRAYVHSKSHFYGEFKSTISFLMTMGTMVHSESLSHGLVFFRNFYLNCIERLPGSYFANGLLGKFEGIPAIICGAGPSLNKNIEVLSTLYDRALIFAGGTALNALNGMGVMPHFGVGIDPNPAQFTRLVMNNAFEVPFLYRCRMLHEALEMVHGDRLYMTGSGGYEVGKWFENQLGVDEEQLAEGFNVLNFSVMIAHAMGCNPIICVGIDLAYTEGDSYASGVKNHPIHSRKEDFRTKHVEDDLISKNDINGKPVYTLWKWIAESMWYTNFADAHPNCTLINATEGGIGFPNVINMTLQEVKQKYLEKQHNLKVRLHGEIQNSPLPRVFEEQRIIKVLGTLKDSLVKCGQICEDVIKSIQKELEESQINENSSKKNSLEEERLFTETAYDAILKRFNEDYLKRNELALHRLERENEVQGAEYYQKKAQLDLERLFYLKDSSLLNAAMIINILEKHQETSQRLKAITIKNETVLEELRRNHPIPSEHQDYVFDDHVFKIKDIDLLIDYEEKFSKKNPLVKESIFYPSGALKAEMHYLDDVLHGPYTFFAENGEVLGRSWYIRGKRSGRTQTYYADGKIHSCELFIEGISQGSHEFFYRDGLPKSILPYQDGVLHGEVFLFYPSGMLFRRVNFVNGKRHGQEQIWNDEGQFIIDCHFEDDRPVGVTREWHSNGVLAKEILYDGDSQRIEEKSWDADGKLIEEDKNQKENYFDLVAKETDKLTASLGDVVDKMLGIAPLISGKFDLKQKLQDQNPLAEDLAILQKEMEKLQNLDNQLKEQLFGSGDESKEAIWKTPASRREMEKQFDVMRERLNTDLEQIRKGVQEVVKSLKKP